MRCPICEALQKDHNHECEVEALAELEQRRKINTAEGNDAVGQLNHTVLASRKRQAELVFRLDRHRTAEHF